MKSFSVILAFLLMGLPGIKAQEMSFPNEPGEGLPFGQPHPEYVQQLADFAPMIGVCDCKSVRRNPDRSWGDTTAMRWKFKYIMDGKAIQDETWKADGVHSGSIRQFIPDSNAWAVTYFSSNVPTASPGVWMGGAVDDKVVLYMPQKAPNGMDGYSKLSFYDITDEGYKWLGEWVDKKDGKENFAYSFWSIICTRSDP